jgi:hypothetical protein
MIKTDVAQLSVHASFETLEKPPLLPNYCVLELEQN